MIVFFITACLSILIPGVQLKSPSQVWEIFLEHVEKAPALEMQFTWNNTVEGTMILQERSFAIHMDEIHVYCNGVERWLYNEGFEEWEALPYETQSANMLENPSAFFSQLRHQFQLSPTSAFKEAVEGSPLWELLLVPQNPLSVFTYIIICLERDGRVPKTIRYGLTDGFEYRIEVLSFQSIPAKEKTFFTPYLLSPDS